MPGTGTSDALVDLFEQYDGDGEPSSPPPAFPTSSTGTGKESSGSSPRTRAANLLGCRGKGTSSQPAKRPKIERNLMDTLDRLADSTAEIEKLRIEAALTMHKDNLIERQENRKLELELFRLQQASGERLATMFADVVKKNVD